MAEASDLVKLKKRLEVVKETKARAEGALGQLAARLQKEHGCKTVEEARKLHAKLQRDAEKAEGAFDRALAQFKKDYEV